ncbi:MAG: glycosyltransferase family 4 protein [Nitriliruptoraceae bacterium]
MRIAIVSPYDLSSPGGVQSHVRQLAARLRAEGEQVVLVGAGPVGVVAGHGAAAEIGVGAGRDVAFNGSVAPVALGPLVVRRTVRALEQLAPDLVHVHEPLVPVVGLAAAFGSPAPLVVTFHAWSDTDRAYRLVRPLGRGVMARTAVAVTVSRAAADYHATALGIDPGSLRIVPNGVDVGPFQQAADAVGDERPPGPPRVVFVGRLEPRKGVLVLAAAFRKLLATHPDAILTVLGDGPQRHQLAAALSEVPASQVRLAGRVSSSALARGLAHADVAVAPALGGESFGIVLLEAMAARTAVVASDLPGYRSVVTDGRDGLLVPPGDADALAGTLARLLSAPQRRAALVAAGEETASAHDWAAVAARLRAVYGEALRSRR